ncbi:MAG: serine hydrolase domain-containing protein [Eubacteriales bacterium]|jgi:CubicO group peptidase (beta-lactamase class C family)
MTNSIIDRLIEESVDARRLPSVSAAIGNRDGELYRKAYGYARCFPDAAPVLEYPPEEFTGKVPVTERTLYDMASLTKVMSTTMVAFRLMERGMLTLDDTLGRYLDAPEDKRDITVRQLMTHTSGMVASKHIDEIDPDPARACESVLSLPLRDKPGRSVEYSCMGYILLGKALEKAGGKRLDELARELVYKPLKMTRTGYNPLERGETDIACTEYRPEYGKYLCGVVHDENARFQNGVSANAGLFSCLDDCVTFARMLLRGGETEDGTRFLSPALLREATRCHTAGMGEARGIGFHINRFPDADVNRYAGPAGELFSPGSFGHTGYTGTNLFVDPVSGLYAVILTNRVHLTRSCDAHLRLRRTVGNAAAAMWGK